MRPSKAFAVTVDGMPLETAYKIVKGILKLERQDPVIRASPLYDLVSAAKSWGVDLPKFSQLDEWTKALMIAESTVSGMIETVEIHGDKLKEAVIENASDPEPGSGRASGRLHKRSKGAGKPSA